MSAIKVRAVSGSKPAFEPGAPVALFESHTAPRNPNDLVFEYDVTADGKRFLVNTTGAAAATPPLTVVVHWNAD